MSKLPGEIRQHLAREHGSNTWILRDLRKSIRNEINILETGQDYDIQNFSTASTCTFLAGAKSQTQNRKCDNAEKKNQRTLQLDHAYSAMKYTPQSTVTE